MQLRGRLEQGDEGFLGDKGGVCVFLCVCVWLVGRSFNLKGDDAKVSNGFFSSFLPLGYAF